MPHSTVYRSEPTTLAQLKLRGLSGTADEIAAAIGVQKSTVLEWRHGPKRPGRRSAERIARAYPSIAPDDWATEVEPPPAAAPTPAEAADAELDPSQVGNVDAVLTLLREIRHAARQPDVTGTTRERLAAREIVARKFLVHLQESERWMQDRIVRTHADWPRVRDTIVQAVAPCAECSARVVAALRELGD